MEGNSQPWHLSGSLPDPLWGVKGILAGVISCLTNAAEPHLTGLEMSSDSVWSCSVTPGKAGGLCIPPHPRWAAPLDLL